MADSYTRHRSKHTTKYKPWEQYNYFPVSCSNQTWGPVQYYYGNAWVGSSKWISDCVTPGYWKLKKSGARLSGNPLRVREEISEIIGSSDLTITTVANTCPSPPAKSSEHDWGQYFTCWLTPLSRPYNYTEIDEKRQSNLRDEVWTKALAGRQAGLTNLVESVAEVDKAFAMLRNPLENINQFLINFRRNARRRRGALDYRIVGDFNQIQFLASEWLRFRFGITPLVNDVKAVMKALKKNYTPAPQVYRSLSNRTVEQSSYSTGNLEGTAIRVGYQRSSRSSYSVKCGVADTYVSTPFNDLGMTFHNVVGVGWELTRLSFLIDRFVNIGDLIYANVPRVGAVTVSQWMTTKSEVITVFSPTGYTNKLPATYTMTGSIGDQLKLTDTLLLRTAPPASPSLVIRDDFKLDNWWYAGDMVSLIVKRLHSITFSSR